MELPEIRLYVGQYLDNNDLLSCALVNKTWHDTFHPYLYHTCDTDIAFCQPQHWPSFLNHLHYTRSLNIYYNTLKDNDEKAIVLQKCTLLRQISFHPAHLNMNFFLRLIQQNPRLRQVNLSIGEVTELHTTAPFSMQPTSCAVEFLETMVRSCPQLTELGVDMMLHPRSEKQFYDIFSKHFMPRLTKLHWAWFRLRHVKTSPWMIDDDNPNTKHGGCNTRAFPNLKDLTVNICVLDMPHPWQEEVVLFENSPNLEILSWTWDPSPLFGAPRFDPSENIDLFINILSRFIKTRWHKLHSFRLSIHNSDTHVFQDEQISRLLKSFQNPLRQFQLTNGNPCTGLTWHALQRHLPTLQKVHLCSETGMTLTSTEIHHVLSSAIRLIDFQHDAILKSSDITIDTQIQSQVPSPIQFPWVCTRLQVLKILLLRHAEDYDKNYTVFKQLAKMTELRELHITSITRGPEFGLNPRDYLHDPTLDNYLTFEGLRSSYHKIRQHPIGRRLLLIWPRLTSCHWHNFK